MTLELREILECLGIKKTLADVTITSVSTDSRNISSGCLFIALVGDNFDGHNFVDSALKAGASCAVVENPSISDDNIILVDSTKLAYLKIAGLHRSKLSTKIIGVTGSVGKTTTKELVACALSSSGKTFKTKANLNNEIGLATMLLELDHSYDYAVLELGIDGPGQMAPMSLAAAPDIAIVTNIGDSHIMEFKTRENIKKEKLNIALGLKDKNMLILNGDDPLLKTESALLYGTENKQGQIYAQNIHFVDYSSHFEVVYKKNVYKAIVPAAGDHNILNSLAAILTSVNLGIDINLAITALLDYKAEGMRQNFVMVRGFTVVEDCYNASPQSMKAAIKTLSSFKEPNRRILVLSDMLELGEHERGYHKEIGDYIGNYNIDALYTTGNLSKEIYTSAVNTGLEYSYYFDNKTELANQLRNDLKENDMVWFKASRGMHLEDVIESLYKEATL